MYTLCTHQKNPLRQSLHSIVSMSCPTTRPSISARKYFAPVSSLEHAPHACLDGGGIEGPALRFDRHGFVERDDDVEVAKPQPVGW